MKKIVKKGKIEELTNSSGKIINKKNKINGKNQEVTSNIESPEKGADIANMPPSIYTGGIGPLGYPNYGDTTLYDNKQRLLKIVEDIITKHTENYKLPSLDEVTEINPDAVEVTKILNIILNKEKNVNVYLAVISSLVESSSKFELEPQEIKALKNKFMNFHVLIDSN